MEGSKFSAYSLRTMKNKVLTVLLILLSLGVAGLAHAAETPGAPTEDKFPRFSALGADEVNVRTGPGTRYPIKFILKKDLLTVEIVNEFDVWRQIRTLEGDEGWVHKTLLSGKRTVIIKGHMQTLLKKAELGTKPVVKLEPGVIATLDRCENEWCYLKVASYKGWIKRENIWGVYPDEKFKK